jgi:hypothetical protein
MVKRCVICGIVDNDVSVHGYLQFHTTRLYIISIKYYVTFSFPNDVRRPEWVAFVVDRGVVVNRASKLCSRHFVPGIDYAAGNAQRRRLLHTAVPSLVSVQIIPLLPIFQNNYTMTLHLSGCRYISKYSLLLFH